MGLFSLTSLTVTLLCVQHVLSHGFMYDPPMRSSMWRFGYDAPRNDLDQGLNCGTFDVQWGQNDGLCGECGDNYADPRPRDNESGGKWWTGEIVREYKEGSEVPIVLSIQAPHIGYFEFRVCPRDDPLTLETQECFDQNLLQLADGSGTQFHMNEHIAGNYTAVVKLPEGVTCTNCVMQWYWRAGNRWGDCGNGTSAGGCGPQESYRNCADVSIL